MAGPGVEPRLLGRSPQVRSTSLARNILTLTWDTYTAVALADGPVANSGFEIAAVDLFAPLGELQERL